MTANSSIDPSEFLHEHRRLHNPESAVQGLIMATIWPGVEGATTLT